MTRSTFLLAIGAATLFVACGSDGGADTAATTVLADAETTGPAAVTSTSIAVGQTVTTATVEATGAAAAVADASDPPACSGISPAEVDLTHLSVGDGWYVSEPTCDRVFACRTSYDGGGASSQGPWFNGDGTWDLTKKLEVGGAVAWNPVLSVTVEGDRRVISTNDLPDHPTGEFPIGRDEPVSSYDGNPNSIAEQSISFTVPAEPQPQSSATCVGGEVGILLTGAMLFNSFDAGGRDAVAWEAQDSCAGHPQISGVYHYHSLSSCIEDPGAGHSELLGYAFDGFGIYGTRGEDGEPVTNADLDQCHGHTHTITWDGEQVEMYHYHATAEFPYVIGCLRGEATKVDSGGGGEGRPKP